VASLLGNITAAFEGVEYGRLHFRSLERDKITSLKEHKGNFEAVCYISGIGRKEIEWWRDNVSSASKSLYQPPNVDDTIFTDVSNEGWGAYDENITINGRWTKEEKELHINELELNAIHIALFSFIKNDDIRVKHTRIISDNATAIVYINNQGGCKSTFCNKLSSEIWQFCINKGIHMSAARIPGVHNVIVDVASRQFKDSAEWMLDPLIFIKVSNNFGMPDIDLFATRLINNYLVMYLGFQTLDRSTLMTCLFLSITFFVYISSL